MPFDVPVGRVRWTSSLCAVPQQPFYRDAAGGFAVLVEDLVPLRFALTPLLQGGVGAERDRRSPPYDTRCRSGQELVEDVRWDDRPRSRVFLAWVSSSRCIEPKVVPFEGRRRRVLGPHRPKLAFGVRCWSPAAAEVVARSDDPYGLRFSALAEAGPNSSPLCRAAAGGQTPRQPYERALSMFVRTGGRCCSALACTDPAPRLIFPLLLRAFAVLQTYGRRACRSGQVDLAPSPAVPEKVRGPPACRTTCVSFGPEGPRPSGGTPSGAPPCAEFLRLLHRGKSPVVRGGGPRFSRCTPFSGGTAGSAGSPSVTTCLSFGSRGAHPSALCSGGFLRPGRKRVRCPVLSTPHCSAFFARSNPSA
ncbi:hypothetical protein MHYP_G00321040 [Metynnis hypsauchen]